LYLECSSGVVAYIEEERKPQRRPNLKCGYDFCLSFWVIFKSRLVSGKLLEA
jgi:hypothetical protein